MKTFKPKVSVIVPVYNVENYLEKCLNSLLTQTFEEFEVICIDDGSTDHSGRILQSFSKKDNRIRLISQSNQGISVARNVGIEEARGDYLYFVDSDDYLEKNTLEILYSQSVIDKLDILYFNSELEFEDDIIKNKFQLYRERFDRKQSYPYILNGKEMFSLMYQNNDFRINLPFQFIRREFITDNHLYFLVDLSCEDVLFSFVAMLKANRVSHIDKALYHRLIRSNSLMTEEDKGIKIIAGWMICYARMIQAVMEMNFSEEEANSITIYLNRFQNKALSQYLELTEREKYHVQQMLGIPEKIIINALVQRNQSQYNEINTLKKQLINLQKQLSNLQNQPIYRIWRIIVWLPKHVLMIIKKIQHK